MNTLNASIAGAYFGAKVFCRPYANKKSILVGGMVGVGLANIYVKFKEWQSLWFGQFEDCQLILKRLADITDEDAIEVAKINGWSSKAPRRKLKEMGNACVGGFCMARAIKIDAADYLRSRGYDLGYLDTPSLIDAGIAVDEKTLSLSKTN